MYSPKCPPAVTHDGHPAVNLHRQAASRHEAFAPGPTGRDPKYDRLTA